MAPSRQRASKRAWKRFLLYTKANGFTILECPPYTGVNNALHRADSAHRDRFTIDGQTWGGAADINWPGGGETETKMLTRLSSVALAFGIAPTFSRWGHVPNHDTHLHGDPFSYGNLGKGLFVPALKSIKPSSMQIALRTPRKKTDNLYGSDGRKRMNAIRKASKFGGNKHPYGVRYTQSVIGRPQTGEWNKGDALAHDNAVKRIQAVLGRKQTGVWDRGLERATIDFNDKYGV